uniref:Uncharacterized protein n=1 Tax=Rhizophora mucronata TaxID=61149 RepID=A0A2P2Q7U5_RHIMU
MSMLRPSQGQKKEILCMLFSIFQSHLASSLPSSMIWPLAQCLPLSTSDACCRWKSW